MKRAIITMVIVLVGMLSGVTAQQVPVLVSMPEVTAQPGRTVEIPVDVSDLTGLGIVASDLLIHYDARVVQATGVRLLGTLTHRWTQANRVDFVAGSQDTVGLIDIALATANRIPSGAGVLVYVEFDVSETAEAGDRTPIQIIEAVLNSHDPATTTLDGELVVSGGDHLVGDFNGDCVVDFLDFLLFMPQFGTAEGDANWDPQFDLNGDGRVGFADFLIFVSQWGKTCE